MGLITWILERIHRPELEPEHIEPVAHDIVIINGKAICEANPSASDSENSPHEARACREAVARGGKGGDSG